MSSERCSASSVFSRMRIALTSYFYRRRGGGGVCAHVDALRRQLLAHGHDVTLLSYVSAAVGGSMETPEGVRAIPLPATSDRMAPFHAGMGRAYRHLNAEGEVELLHAHNTAGLCPAINRVGTPVVLSIHNVALDDAACRGAGARWRRWRERTLLQLAVDHADRVVVVSEKVAHLASSLGVGLPVQHTVVIPPGIDTALFHPGDRTEATQRSAGGAHPVILSVQRMTPRKGALDLLEAVAAVQRAIPHVRLIVIGDGPAAAEFDREVHRRGLEERVVRISHVEQAELADYYRAADVFVNTTHEAEAYGMVTGEAIACGTPVICTPEAADTGAVDPACLLIYRDKAELIRHVTGLHTRPEQGRDLVANGQSGIASLSTVVDRMESIYACAAAEPCRPRPSAHVSLAKLRGTLYLSDLLYGLHHRAASGRP